ncbi:glycosyltransferase family 39 protein [Rhodobacteraceae bacterium NNCM2]|nr:glycosyltransferase family 39 protein [Coraliihabitans acroporae]
MARAATKSTTSAPRKRKRISKKAAAEAQAALKWQFFALAVIVAALSVRLAINGLELVPVHFDEAQYWAYGQELAWGYFSKPPLVGAVIRLTTDLFGDTLFALRLASPIAHALIAWLIFLTSKRLFDAATGFWASAGYTLAPGVGVSSMIVSTDPIMMVFWAIALYALVRASPGKVFWLAVMGVAIGLGMLAKYTMIAFAFGVIGWALFSADRRDWRGYAVALVCAGLVFLPNILWNMANSFATVTHVAEDANPGGSMFNPGKLAEFVGAQFGVIGVMFFAALGVVLWHRKRWLGDPGMRLLAWQTFPLLLAIIGLAFVTRAQPNWAVPAYIAGSIMAARWLLTLGWQRWIVWGQFALSCAAVTLVWGLAVVYADGPVWPRFADPFKKMRIAEPYCEQALGVMSEEGAEILLSDDRRRLSECMFLGGLSWDEVAIWNPDLLPDNHHELVATLYPGDDRVMLLATLDNGVRIARMFEEAREIEAGTFPTHSDRNVGYSLWVVQGFKGY